jgi:hypothetical protein
LQPAGQYSRSSDAPHNCPRKARVYSNWQTPTEPPSYANCAAEQRGVLSDHRNSLAKGATRNIHRPTRTFQRQNMTFFASIQHSNTVASRGRPTPSSTAAYPS